MDGWSDWMNLTVYVSQRSRTYAFSPSTNPDVCEQATEYQKTVSRHNAAGWLIVSTMTLIYA